MIDVLVIEPGSWTAVPQRVEPKLEDFQRLVGGHIEALSLADEVSAYINEEGKYEGLARNEAADRFVKLALRKVGRTMIPGDYVAGPLVITGQPDGDGYDTSAPEQAMQLLSEAGVRVGEPGEPAVEVIVPDEPVTKLAGYEGRTLRTRFETSIPNVVLNVSTSHWKDRKEFGSVAGGVRLLGSDGVFTSELSSPMDWLTVCREPVARFSAKALAEAHHHALARVIGALLENPDAFTAVLLKTPERD